jgi:hypothetical protein
MRPQEFDGARIGTIGSFLVAQIASFEVALFLPRRGRTNQPRETPWVCGTHNDDHPERAQQDDVPPFVLPLQGEHRLGAMGTQGVALG